MMRGREANREGRGMTSGYCAWVRVDEESRARQKDSPSLWVMKKIRSINDDEDDNKALACVLSGH